MEYITANTPSRPGRQSLSMSREAVPNLNQRIRVGAFMQPTNPFRGRGSIDRSNPRA
jgi:hypothetical protein